MQWSSTRRNTSVAEVSSREGGVPGVLCWEEEFSQYLAVKISKDSPLFSKKEVDWKLRCSLKGPAYRLIHLQMVMDLKGRGATPRLPETNQEKKRSCIASR